jgi:poly-gamma-glutamate capsule biosynthesis protein CapA/YwtB (metallophosphatase superfamily)
MSDKKDESPVKSNAIDRRTVLVQGTAAMGGVLAGSLLKPDTAEASTLSGATANRNDNTFTLSVAGECLTARPFSMQTEPEFLGIVELLRESDVAFGHLEMNFGTDEEIGWTPRGTAGRASYMIADPQVAHDLRWAGFHSMSLAHNHSFDWGGPGIRSTIKHCREAGIAVAGTGNDLEEARSPTYFETDKGRVAMISVGSGNNQYEWAGYGKGNIPGRPGVNPLRVFKRYEVDHAAAEQLRAIGKNLGVLSDAEAARPEFNITPGTGVGGTGAASFTFADSDKFDIVTTGHPRDIEGNLRSVDEARRMADFVIVSHHNSLSEESRGTTPPDFMYDFARKSIDAGADIYVGHGWHTFLGIEIYKGKPIIYGTGNFFMQTSYLTRVPPDSYEAWGYNLDQLTTLHPAIGDLHPGGGQENWNWTALFQLKFVDNRLSEIVLHPVEMGMDFSSGKGEMYRTVGSGEHKLIDGTPWLAGGSNGQAILERLQRMCALRGTEMQISGGVGIITV